MVIKPTGSLFQWVHTSPDLGLLTSFALNEMKVVQGAIKSFKIIAALPISVLAQSEACIKA